MLGLIKEIQVDGLFGRYDYRIPLRDDLDEGLSRLSLLYGDNGSGKTTILNLVFHLLSSELLRSHKTYIARVPFRNLRVTFSDETTIFASRPSTHLLGDFQLGLTAIGQATETVFVRADPETDVIPHPPSPQLEGLLNKIGHLVPDIFYLRDNRTLESDTLPDPRRSRSTRLSRLYDADSVVVEHGFPEPRESILRESIDRTKQHIYVQLAMASTRGEADARQIYANILRSIASASASSDTISEETAQLEVKLEELETISSQFAEFGLGSTIQAAPFAEALSSADEFTLPVVVQVLKSFLDGQTARLSALDNLYKKMHNLVMTTNGYLTGKTIEMDVSDGLTIHIQNKQLDAGVLSSGEQHLLLLFLNVFNTGDQPSLFIIDEPELSLNVKWQRQLIDSLLRLTQNTSCQFLLATHSIELLSRHRQYVRRLTNYDTI